MRILCMCVMMGVVILAGCGPQAPPPPQSGPTSRPATSQPTSAPAHYLSRNAVTTEGDNPSQTAVENALSWANKYSQAMQSTAQLQQDLRAERDRIQTLQVDKTRLTDELASAQKELKEANAMLLEMRQELNRWKLDVLGFRQEIRTGQQAQAQALARIIKLLGGEAPAATSAPASEPASAPSH